MEVFDLALCALILGIAFLSWELGRYSGRRDDRSRLVNDAEMIAIGRRDRARARRTNWL